MKGKVKMDDGSTDGKITVNIVKRKTGGVGFLAVKRNFSPYLAVSHVVKGGVAHETGFIEAGDIILEVNGKSLENVPYLTALEILDNIPTGETLTLKICARDGFHAHLETAFDENGVVKTVRTTRPKTPPNVISMNGNVNGETRESTSEESRSNGISEKGRHEKERLLRHEESSTNCKKVEQEIPYNESKVCRESIGVQTCPVANGTVKPQQQKYVKLQNLVDGNYTTDTLHQKAIIVS